MLTLAGVRKSYGSLIAVDGLSLTIGRGEIFGLLGPNGAGKSTTVHLAVGLLRPDAGTISIESFGSPDLSAVRAHIGVAPQVLSLYDPLSAEENLAFLGHVYGLHGKSLADRIDWALNFVGLAERRRGQVRTFSGGMKRRLNLAAAVIHDPDLILLDEPTVGVDPQSRNAIFENILELKQLGRTIVYTTHYMEEAERLCDRVGIMDRGRMLALDTVPRLLAGYGARPALIIENDGSEERIETDDPLAELNRRSQAGKMGQFRMEQPNLEQVFLKLTGKTLRD